MKRVHKFVECVKLCMEEKLKFSERLRKLRESAGLSQPELAELSGVAVGTIRNFEQGISWPRWDILQRLTLGLGVSAGVWDGLEDEKPHDGKSSKRKKR